MAGKRKGVSYNSRFQEDNPDEEAPKTTMWRLKKRLKHVADTDSCNQNTDVTDGTDKTDEHTGTAGPLVGNQLHGSVNNLATNNDDDDQSVDIAGCSSTSGDGILIHNGDGDTVPSVEPSTNCENIVVCIDPPINNDENNTPESSECEASGMGMFAWGGDLHTSMEDDLQPAEQEHTSMEDDLQPAEQEQSLDITIDAEPDGNQRIFEDCDEDPEVSEAATVQDGIFEDNDNQPLYPGAQITVAESVALNISCALRHNMTGQCLADMLTISEMHCPRPNLCKTSLYKLKQNFSTMSDEIIYHVFCASCGLLIQKPIPINCPNELCRRNLKDSKNISYFIEIPIASQIKALFQRQGFHPDIMHRFSRKKVGENHVEDLYDGELYKEHFKKDGLLSGPTNLSLMWYTDGAPPFKSSKASLWPVSFVVNELPPEKRMKVENMIIAGLWFGEGKPCMSSYLKPICDSLDSLYSNGIDVSCGHCHEEFNSKILLLCGTCDLPAKCNVLNMTQFNGEFGCSNCMQSGEVVTAGRGHARVFPINEDNVTGPERLQEEMIMQSVQALDTGKPVNGVKGPSWFSALTCHDIVRGTGIDYMHGVLLGVVRRLLCLWFDSNFSKQPFSISKKVGEVDGRLLSIKPPSCISRLPRSISVHIKQWKANELRSWLFYYSSIALHGILAEEFYQHYLLLVEAIYILNQRSISPVEIEHCERVLVSYCVQFQILYGKRHMTMNVHQLVHLTDVVKRLGPLWVYSCFSFEGMNGKLLKFIHGGTKPIKQIANSVATMFKITEIGEQLCSKHGSPVGEFVRLLKNKGKRLALTERIAEGSYVIGAVKNELLEVYQEPVLSALGVKATEVKSFLRAKVGGLVVCSNLYTALNERVSSVVCIKGDDSVGRVEKFLRVKQCSCFPSKCQCKPMYLVELRKYSRVHDFQLCSDDLTNATLKHIQVVSLPPVDRSFVFLTDISDICVYMNVPGFTDKAFLAKPPNHLEGD